MGVEPMDRMDRQPVSPSREGAAGGPEKGQAGGYGHRGTPVKRDVSL